MRRRQRTSLVGGSRVAVRSLGLRASQPALTSFYDTQQAPIKLQYLSSNSGESSSRISTSFSDSSHLFGSALSVFCTKTQSLPRAHVEVSRQTSPFGYNELFFMTFLRAQLDRTNVGPSPPFQPKFYYPLTVYASIQNGMRLKRVFSPVLSSLARAYATHNRSDKKDRTDDKPKAFPSQTLRMTESTTTTTRIRTLDRFSHRRDRQGKSSNKGGAKKDPEATKNALDDQTSPSPSCSVYPRSGEQLGSSFSSHHTHHEAAQQHRDYLSEKDPSASEATRSGPTFLRGGKRNIRRGKRRKDHRTSNEEEEVYTEWRDTSAPNSYRTERSMFQTISHAAPTTSDPQASTINVLSIKAPTRNSAASFPAPEVSKETPSARDAEERPPHPSDPQSSTTTKSLPFFAKTNNVDHALLRKLLRAHKTFAQNFATLQQSSAVVASLERLGTEALARSGLLEALAEVFMPGEEVKLESAKGDRTSEALNLAENTAGSASSSSVLLVLRHLSGTCSPSVALQADNEDEAIATLEVSQRVIDWLNSPIEAPPWTAVEMMTSVEEEVAQFEARRTRARDMSARPVNGEAAPDGELNKDELVDGGLHQWYVQWGQQRQKKKEARPAQDHADTGSFSSTPKVHKCMSLWYGLHVRLSQVLLTHFDDVNPSLAPGNRRKPATSGKMDKDSSHDDWRSLPRTEFSVNGKAQPRNGNSKEGGPPPTRPDQTVKDEMHVLLRTLDELRQTLHMLKFGMEGSRLMTSTSTVGETRGNERRNAVSSNDSLQYEDENQTTTPSSTDENSVAGDNGEVSRTETIFAQLRHALLQLQQAEATDATTAPSDSSHDSSAAANTAARKRARRAGDKWLSLVSRIDSLHMLRDSTTLVNEEPHDAVFVSLASSSLASSSCSTTTQRSVANTPRYAISVLDLLLSVVLRCLLFYVPALPYAIRRVVVESLTQPWIVRKQSVVVSLWITQFTVTSLLATDRAAEKRNHSLCNNKLPRGSATQPVDTDSSAQILYRHIAFLLRSFAKSLRFLCWPTIFDYRFAVVQHLFELPTVAVRGDKITLIEAENAASTSHQVAFTTWTFSETTKRPAWRDAVSVVESSAEYQCVGYALLLFFFAVVDRVGTFDATSPLMTMYVGESSRMNQNRKSCCDSALENPESASPQLTPWRGAEQRTLAAVLLILTDIDRFIAEKHYHKQGLKSLYAMNCFPSPSSNFPLQHSCTETCALQMASRHGLSRVTFCALHQLLTEQWPSLERRKSQILWDVFRYAVVAPVASVLYHALIQLNESAESTASEALLKISRSTEWQASAPVLRSFNAGATPALWKMMWAYVSAELESFPKKMKIMLDAPKGTNARSTSHDQASSPTKRNTSAMSQENEQAAVALRACWMEFGELALLCAWLLVAAEHAFAVVASPSAGRDAAATSAFLNECEDAVRGTFSTSVRSVLALWTELGTTADAGQQLLDLFVFRSTSDFIKGEMNETEKMPDALLLQLMHAFNEQVWTAKLETTVRKWKTQMRFVQEQVSLHAPPSLGKAENDHGTATANVTAEETESTATKLNVVHYPEGIADADPSILGWWRSLQAEDAGLPSTHVYLMQVFTELHRIVSSRKGQDKAAESNTAVRSPAVNSQSSTCSEPHVQPSMRDHSAALAGTNAFDNQGNGKETQVVENIEVMEEECYDGVNRGAEVKRRAPLWAVFSFAELVVILRLLTSISTRGGLATANAYVGASTSTKSASGSDRKTVAASLGRHAGSILDALFCVALHSASVTAATGPTASSVTETFPVEYSSAAPENSAAQHSIADVEHVMGAIEKALFGSISAHATSLPAASLLEAAWLGLYPLSNLSEAFHAARTSVVQNRTNGETTFVKEEGRTASPLPLQASLRTASSVWLETLHNDICRSAHIRLLCCFLLYRHYNVLCLSDEAEALDIAAAEAASNHATLTSLSRKNVSSSTCADDTLLQLAHLTKFFEMIRGSCVEALEDLYATTTAGECSRAIFRKRKGSAAGIEEGLATRAPSLTTSSDDTAVDAAARLPKTLDELDAMKLLKDHARLFLQVFVLSSVLHHHLITHEAYRVHSVATDDRTFPTLSDSDGGTQQSLIQLYATLLAVVETFLSYGERGYCTEVVQMMSMITWRMRDLGFLVLDDSQSGNTVLRVSNEHGAATVTSRQSVKPAANVSACTPFHGVEGPETGKEVGALHRANTGLELLRRYGNVLRSLMPYVDKEVLTGAKRSVPNVLKLMLIISAKAAVEHATRGIPMMHDGSCTKLSVEQATASTTPTSKDLCRTATSEGHEKKGADTLPPFGSYTGSLSSRVKADGSVCSFSSPSSVAALPCVSSAIWSRMPLESFFYRAASEDTFAYRYAAQFSATAILAPELAAALLPVARVWCDYRCHYTPAQLELAFLSIVACARAHHQQSQDEISARDNVSLLASSMASNSAGGTMQDYVGERMHRMRHCPSQGLHSPSRSGELPPSFASLSCATLRVGEVCMRDTPHRSEHRRKQESKEYLPIYRSAGALPTHRETPAPLRRGWVALTRHVLQSEGDTTVAGRVSLWVAALYCGGMVGVAGTQLFEQLLACFVFNPVCTTSTEALHAEEYETRVAQLGVTGWTFLIEACAAASYHHYRESYRVLLKEELVGFLNRFNLFSNADVAERGFACFDDGLPSSIGPALCGLLEAIPKLFVENAEFWEKAVKGAVVRCFDELNSVGGSNEVVSTGTINSALVNEWTNQWMRSYNFAVTSAGYASLAFPDAWTDEAHRAAAEVIVEKVEQSIRELKQSHPVSIGVEKHTRDDSAVLRDPKTTYELLQTHI